MDEFPLELEDELEGLGDLGARRRRWRRRMPSNLEAVQWPLYDSVEIATSATTSLEFFQVPIGQSSKTQLDTNMRSAGQITMGNYYSVYSIGVGLRDGAATSIPVAEAREILYTGYLVFTIAEREYLSGPLYLFPLGGGLAGPGSGAAAMEASNNGMAAANVRYFLKRKIVLRKNENFQVTCKWPTAPTPTTAIKLVVVFDGVLVRARK